MVFVRNDGLDRRRGSSLKANTILRLLSESKDLTWLIKIFTLLGNITSM